MNRKTLAIVQSIAGRMEPKIRAGEFPAIVEMVGAKLERRKTVVLSHAAYRPDDPAAQRFERRAAAKAREIRVIRWVFAVPQIWITTDNHYGTRSMTGEPLGDDEEEAITWMSFDHNNGVDYGRVYFTRRPNGDPVLDQPAWLGDPVRPRRHMPGITMLRSLMGVEADFEGFAEAVGIATGEATDSGAGGLDMADDEDSREE